MIFIEETDLTAKTNDGAAEKKNGEKRYNSRNQCINDHCSCLRHLKILNNDRCSC